MRKFTPTGAFVRAAMSSNDASRSEVAMPAPPSMPSAPAAETAAARSALATPPMPACCRGRSHPTSSVNLVVTIGALLGWLSVMSLLRRSEEVEFEFDQAEEASLEGDVPYVPGSARAALSHRNFTIVWSGLTASNVGTWMQDFTLAAYGWDLTHSAAYVGLLGFAQLGPVLLLSTVGGVLADAFDRRRLIVAMQFGQLVGSLVLALLAAAGHPSTAALFLCVLAIGVFNALT